MTIEVVLSYLLEKYGEEFNWRTLPFPELQGAFVDELKRELGAESDVFHNSVCAVAKCDSNDDVLFFIGDGSAEGLWRIYHLTYAPNHSPGYPRYQEFSSPKAVGDFIEKQLVNELR